MIHIFNQELVREPTWNLQLKGFVMNSSMAFPTRENYNKWII